MPRFIQFIQIVIAVIVGFFVTRDLILHGIGIFSEQWIMISIVTTLLLELSLFIIYKLIEED